MKKKATNTHRTADELNITFYQNYDENFLFNKVLAVWFAIHDTDETKGKFKDFVAKYGMSDEDENKRLLSLKVEVYFSVFLQFEALFALLIAHFQTDPHWLYLTNYTTGEIKDKIDHFLAGNIAEMTDGKINNAPDFISESVYSNLVAPTDEHSKIGWEKNLNNIDFILRQIALTYSDNLKAYNSYKHGLRMRTSNDAALQMGRPPADSITINIGEIISYIGFDKEKDGTDVTVEFVRSFEPQKAFYAMYLMRRLLRTVKIFRIAKLKDETNLEKQGDPVNFFNDLDKRALLSQQSFKASYLV